MELIFQLFTCSKLNNFGKGKNNLERNFGGGRRESQNIQ
jgi:hypothetical protein